MMIMDFFNLLKIQRALIIQTIYSLKCNRPLPKLLEEKEVRPKI